MRDIASLCKIAVVQAAPVMFDKGACVEKAVKLIHIAVGMSAELIVFPELFIPGYPYGKQFVKGVFSAGVSLCQQVYKGTV